MVAACFDEEVIGLATVAVMPKSCFYGEVIDLATVAVMPKSCFDGEVIGLATVAVMPRSCLPGQPSSLSTFLRNPSVILVSEPRNWKMMPGNSCPRSLSGVSQLTPSPKSHMQPPQLLQVRAAQQLPKTGCTSAA